MRPTPCPLHGLATDRVHVVPNAVRRPAAPSPTRRPAPPPGPLRLPSGVPVVACIGSLSAEKQVDAAIDAVARLPDTHLLVVGDGPRASDLRAQARSVAPGRIHLVGALPGPATALAAADLVVLASRTEGMPG